MDGAERQLFEQAVRRATTTCSGDAAALDAALGELGWHDALATERRTAIPVLFEAQGAAVAASSALDHVVLGALGVDPGTGAGAVVLPPLGRWRPPGRLGAGLSAHGLGTSALSRAAAALVVADTGEGAAAVSVPPEALALRPVEGMDPWLGLVVVQAETDRMGPGVALAPDAWAAAVDEARLALGHELVGAAGAMLDLARVHALERVQFGRPIAAFQAVRHRLADTLVAVEAARALLGAAWDDRSSDTVAMAKAVAGRSARLAARHCQQVLAGMGFTTEHPLHRYVRRVLVLDELFGSARSLTGDLGRSLVAGGPLPAPVAL